MENDIIKDRAKKCAKINVKKKKWFVLNQLASTLLCLSGNSNSKKARLFYETIQKRKKVIYIYIQYTNYMLDP